MSNPSSSQDLSQSAKNKLVAKYPGEQIVASCSVSAVGRTDSFAALYSGAEKRVRVVSIAKNGELRELEVLPAIHGDSFELQCMDAKEAKERKEVLRKSEAMRDFLRVPAGHGAVCYFTSDTETKCWSTDKTGKLIEAGGWQT